MNDIKTFEEDTIVFFDRTDFNLKGYEYFIYDNLCFISPSHFDKLREELGETLYEYAISYSTDRDKICFSEDDFEETFNPFKEKV